MSDPGADRTRVEHCPACGSADREFAFSSHDWIYGVPGTFPLARCHTCGSMYPDPRPSPEALSAYYPEGAYYSYSEPGRHRLFARTELPARLWYMTVRGTLRARYGYEHLGGSRLLGATLGRTPPLHARATFSLGPLLHPWQPDGALLDVGCGSGRYLDLMRALGWSRVVGVDISERAVRTARDALGLEAYEGDMREVSFPAASFDAVSLSHTLEHVDDPVALLKEIRRVTRPGGRVAIIVPNVRSMLSRLLGEHWLGLETPRHLVNFTPLGLRIVLEEAGLQIASLTTSPQGSYGVALFSLSRARGDPRDVYTNERHRFGIWRRSIAGAASSLERALCAAGRPAGELIAAVARA